MSYRRSDKILTKHLFEYCTYVVREKEADAYRHAGIDDMLIIPEYEVWDFMSTLYWLIQHASEDVIFVADDDIELAFDQPTLAPYAYTSEFSFVGMTGHIHWINRKALKAVYDKYEWTASDVDMMMQELLKNRIILQPKYLCVKAGMDLNAGGDLRKRKEYLLFVDAMKNK